MFITFFSLILGMVESNEIVRNVIVVALIAMMLGVFSPYLFPDRRRIVNNYIDVLVPTIVYLPLPNVNVTSIVNDNLKTNIYDNRTFTQYNYSINQDVFDYNTTDVSISFGTTTFRYQSIRLNQTSNITSLTLGYSQLTTSNVQFDLKIYSAKYNSMYNHYEPYLYYKNFSDYITFPITNTVGMKILNISNFNLMLNVDSTEGKTFFLQISTKTGTPRPQLNYTTNEPNFKKVSTSSGVLHTIYEENNFNFLINYSLTSIAHSQELLEELNTSISNIKLNFQNSSFSYRTIGNNVTNNFYSALNLSFNEVELIGNTSVFDFDLISNTSIVNIIINATYTINITSINIYLNSKYGQYNYYWNSEIRIILEVNSVEYIAILTSIFYYVN